jgi:4-amino-4-deoxy-L-arabinose transferase-like glycosyltransferase
MKKSTIFKLIIVLAVILRFWNLTAGDLFGDAPLYSWRALGWFDFMGGGQTTPIQWFNEIPWWANLSFHDHPPMVFFIQHIFFKLLGPSVLAARLPFALAGIGAGFAIYYLLKARDENVALIAFFIFTVSSYAIWGSRTGYLEGILVLFISLSILFFQKYLGSHNKKDLYWWAAFMGCAFLSKYNAIFLAPAVLVFILIWRKDLFTNRDLWKSAGIFFLVLSPIIIYNTMVYQTRGHFDFGLSSMLGMSSDDLSALANRGINLNLYENFLTVSRTIMHNKSLPIFILSVVSFLYYLVKVLRRKGDELSGFLIVNMLFLLFFFMFAGGEERWGSIIEPFFAILSALFIKEIYDSVRLKKKSYSIVLVALLIFSFGWELSYAFNTNILPRHYGKLNRDYSAGADYLANKGWNQLDDYLKNEVIKTLPPIKKIRKIEEMGLAQSDVLGKEVIFYDDLVDWYAYSWYLQPYTVYYKIPVLPISQAWTMTKSDDPFTQLKAAGVKGFYYIETTEITEDKTKTADAKFTQQIRELSKKVEERGELVKEIRNLRDELCFKIYHFEK